MRITDPEIIRTGENDLINSIKNDLDWDAVKSIIKNRINMDSFNSKGGEIVVIDGKIAFRINLELKMAVSLMFDRDGNYIEGNDKSRGIDFPDNLSSSQKSDLLQNSDSSQKIDETDRVGLDTSVQMEMETQVEKNDLEFGLPDFSPQSDDKNAQLSGDDFDMGTEVNDSTVRDVSAEAALNSDSDSDSDLDFDLDFDDDLNNLGLDDSSHEKSDSDLNEKVNSSEENDTLDDDIYDDIDDDIDDILEETRELWKKKKE